MPKKKDENETAFATLQEIIRRDAQRDGFTGEPESKHEKLKYRFDAGTKGARVWMEKLSPEHKSEIAKNAAKARWGKSK